MVIRPINNRRFYGVMAIGYTQHYHLATLSHLNFIQFYILNINNRYLKRFIS